MAAAVITYTPTGCTYMFMSMADVVDLDRQSYRTMLPASAHVVSPGFSAGRAPTSSSSGLWAPGLASQCGPGSERVPPPPQPRIITSPCKKKKKLLTGITMFATGYPAMPNPTDSTPRQAVGRPRFSRGVVACGCSAALTLDESIVALESGMYSVLSGE